MCVTPFAKKARRGLSTREMVGKSTGFVLDETLWTEKVNIGTELSKNRFKS